MFGACCAVLERLLRPTEDSFIDEQPTSPTTGAAPDFESEALTAIGWYRSLNNRLANQY